MEVNYRCTSFNNLCFISVNRIENYTLRVKVKKIQLHLKGLSVQWADFKGYCWHCSWHCSYDSVFIQGIQSFLGPFLCGMRIMYLNGLLKSQRSQIWFLKYNKLSKQYYVNITLEGSFWCCILAFVLGLILISDFDLHIQFMLIIFLFNTKLN